MTLSADQATEMIAAVIFHVRPGIEEQTTWLDGEPTSDPFRAFRAT